SEVNNSRRKEAGHLETELARALGALIEAERKRHGMTQEALAAEMGVSQNAITSWERGAIASALRLPVILQLEEVFRLPKGALLHRLGGLSRAPDFEAVVLANPALNEEQNEALNRHYRAMPPREPEREEGPGPEGRGASHCYPDLVYAEFCDTKGRCT